MDASVPGRVRSELGDGVEYRIGVFTKIISVSTAKSARVLRQNTPIAGYWTIWFHILGLLDQKNPTEQRFKFLMGDLAISKHAQIFTEAGPEFGEAFMCNLKIKKLREMLEEIRGMTKMDPAVFSPKLTSLLLSCGVALIFLPHIGGSFLHGATFMDGKKVVMGLTLRGKYADKFWFSLFHEIAHILYGHIGQIEGTSQEDEEEADRFARDTLIAPEDYGAFLLRSKKVLSSNNLRDFADHIGVDVGIVVGRLQNDKSILHSQFNDLKCRYDFG